MKLIECVINISEGRNLSVIHKIAEAAKLPGVALLHLDPGSATNRTVISFAGEVEAMQEAAFRVIERATALIDMRGYHSPHPYIGAVDVCPFVPLGETTMSECIACAREVGARVANQFEIPVYLYGAAAKDPERAKLSQIRRGGYAGLQNRFEQGDLPPDFGPARFDPRLGAIAVGAREILIAFNVNLKTISQQTAATIAAALRSSAPRDRADCLSWRLAHCQAIGWFMPEYGCAQVSANLTDFRITPPHLFFESVKTLANQLGTSVTGSELIGLIPKGALLAAGLYYTRTAEGGEDFLIEVAIKRLGLQALRAFVPGERILEAALARAGWQVII